MGPSFFWPYATFGCRVARRPRLRGAGAGAIGSGAAGSRSGSGVAGIIASLPIAFCIAASDWRRNSQSTTSELFPPHANAQRSAAAIAASKFGELTAKFGELVVKFGELAAPGNSNARNPAHGCCQVNRSQSVATISTAIATPMARAVDSIAGAQSARSAALKVVIVLGGGGDQPGPLRVLAGWLEMVRRIASTPKPYPMGCATASAAVTIRSLRCCYNGGAAGWFPLRTEAARWW